MFHKMILLFLFLSTLCGTTISCAARTTSLKPSEGFQISHRVILQPVDHADPEGPKLEQQVDILIPDGVPPDAPVFFNLGNEADLTDEDLLKRLRLHGTRIPLIYVQAEHRGYGQSLTSDDDQSVPLYVSTEQALADAHAVIQQLKKDYGGPWMAAGWSYGGGLVIDFASRYPEDVEAVLSSSGVVDWPLVNYSYDRQVRATLGEACYRRMAKHMDNLQSKELFDDNWLEREFLTSLTMGVVQYQEFNKLQRYFNILSFMPTPVLLRVGHWMDERFSGGEGRKYAQALRMKHVTRGQIVSDEYSWHVWRYQQCSEVGVFLASEGSDGIFKGTKEEFCDECRALFGEARYADEPEWSLRKDVRDLKVPLVYVSGGKDPWYAVGLEKDSEIPRGRNFHVPEGFHCPDRDNPELARQVLQELLKFAKQKHAERAALSPDKSSGASIDN